MFTRWLPQGSRRRIIAGNTLSQLVGRAISSASVVIVSLLIARRYGPDGYGDFVKITTYVGFFYLLADFGLNAVYLQKATHGERTSTTTSQSWWRILFGLRLVISIFLIGIALLIMKFLPEGLSQGYTPLVRFGIAVLVPVILAQAITNTTNAWFQKILRYDRATVAQNAGSIAMVLFAAVAVTTTHIAGPMLGVFSVMAGSACTAIVALMLVGKDIRPVFPEFPKKGFASLFRSSIPLGLALVFNLIYFHADSVILTLTRSTREVGIYGLAYKVFELPLVIPIFFMNAVYPMLLTAAATKASPGSHASNGVFRKSLWFLLTAAFGVSIIMWFAAPLLTWVRPDFADSILPLRILILGMPIFFTSALYMWFIIAERQQMILLVIHGSAMLINIICNILLVPRYGYVASAWITITSELLVLASSMVFVTVRRMKMKGGVI